jgi:hypothetical protein
MRQYNLIWQGITALIVATAVAFACYFGYQTIKVLVQPTASPIPVTVADTPDPITETPTPIPTITPILPTVTPTPYTLIYPGFLYCHSNPDGTSIVVTILRGEQITIIEQDHNRKWFHVIVQTFNGPNTDCWIHQNAPNLNLDPNDVTRVPTIVITIYPTFTLPAPKP